MAYARIQGVYDLTGNGPPTAGPLTTLWGQAFTVYCPIRYSNLNAVPINGTTAVLAIRGIVNGVETVQSVTGSIVSGQYQFVVSDAQYAALTIGDYYFEVWLYFGIAATCVVKKSILTIAPVVPGAPGNNTPALPWLAQPAYATGAEAQQTYNQTAVIGNGIGMAIGDATNGAFQLTLPTGTANKKLTVKKNDLTGNTITLICVGGVQIERAASWIMSTPGVAVELSFDGTMWIVAG